MHYSQSPPLAEALDLDAISDQPISDQRVGSNLRNHQVARDRLSVGRRIFRGLTRFFIAILIGVGGTLAWQSYGDVAREMVIVRAPTLAWLLSVSTTKSPAVAATSPAPVPQPKPPQPRAQSSAVQSSPVPRPPPPAGPLVLSR